MKQLLKAPLQAKHESPYRLLTKESEQKLYTFNDQHYAKVNHTTKHLTLSKQCTVPVFNAFWYSVQNAVGSIQCGVGGTPK